MKEKKTLEESTRILVCEFGQLVDSYKGCAGKNVNYFLLSISMLDWRLPS